MRNSGLTISFRTNAEETVKPEEHVSESNERELQLGRSVTHQQEQFIQEYCN